jgi:hypothetical protein
MSTEGVPLYRTETGGRRHIRKCPHLLDKDVVEATDDGPICSWCDKELRGEGREYFDSLDDALRALGGPQDNWPAIRRELAAIDADEVWIPFSRSYIALGRNKRAVAWAGKNYVEPSAGSYVELPGFRAGAGGGKAVVEVWGERCEKHFIQRSRSGRCERCDD